MHPGGSNWRHRALRSKHRQCPRMRSDRAACAVPPDRIPFQRGENLRLFDREARSSEGIRDSSDCGAIHPRPGLRGPFCFTGDLLRPEYLCKSFRVAIVFERGIESCALHLEGAPNLTARRSRCGASVGGLRAFLGSTLTINRCGRCWSSWNAPIPFSARLIEHRRRLIRRDRKRYSRRT